MERDDEYCGLREDEVWLAVAAEQVDSSTTLSERRMRLWALVLEARFLPCRMEQVETGWQLLVPADKYAAALHELRLFSEENRNWPPAGPPQRPLVDNTLATLSVIILLATFHNLTRLDLPLFGTFSPDWTTLGRANSARIMAGDWWRLVTALTLHSDWLHLFSNLAFGSIFAVCICHELGSGLAWTLLLGSGVLGNLANAAIQPHNHSSIGSSTVVFGAVGILAAISMVRYRTQLRKRWFLPIAAALALLALLGSEGANTDLGAHLFGFLAGTGLGLAAEYLLGKRGRPGRLLNALLALASAGVVLVSWWAALAAAGPLN